MVIEWLKFQVEPQLREKFIQTDREIWTQFLAQYDGYVGKEIWLDADNLEQIVITIYWQTKEQWKSIPAERLQEKEAQFEQKFGKASYQLLSAKEYQIRQFLAR